ncbi:SusC/RagA family TonB-linked outer membrane protein [Mucilaginibacter galii]|uniref:SusC/RagA family TonB-linked outer membrane protein n=1 Tax=Mucilaginibacter galii TaxID=2005073 RepID=A0A917JAA1_9SPHI|nr:SusC/RagA family TonB-linked outer membrane protein [Mucilaginibacter galii]GGI51688.1 SusC/RagA family TonB-linked outer membrane protein [Mucilaginibacter galii]
MKMKFYQKGISRKYGSTMLSLTTGLVFAGVFLVKTDAKAAVKAHYGNGLTITKALNKTSFADINISGTVMDEKGQPLTGVSVKVKGSSAGTMTDPSGVFKITAPENATLVISYIGYQSKEVPVGGKTSISITLTPSSNSLNEVVVTSFGIKRQARAVGYATSTVTGKEITEAGATNFGSALYGKAAGVQVTTAPGGASSAVNIQIRGLTSLGFQQQPLYVVDGVIIRSENQYGPNGRNNGGFYDDQRIRGNGILDINPQDIESLNILKGAAASSLYGSDANAGVIIITTKKGSKSKGPQVAFNYVGTMEQAAFMPKFQNVYGQGYDRATNLAVGATEEGWIPDAASPNGVRPNFRAYANFGPKMEGQQVRWWDGSIRSYSPQPDNYKNIFRNGFSSQANVSLSNQTDNADYRISASRLDYNSIQRESNQQRNTFGLNSGLKLSKTVSVDIVANYVNTLTHNRPYQTNRLAQSFDGFFGREEDMNLILDKYQTSQGYAFVPFNQTARNPSEAFVFNVRPNLYDYFFTTLKNTYDENENRLYTSATLNWDVLKHLRFRGRIGQDYTGRSVEEKGYNQYPVAFNPVSNSTGNFNVSTGIYSVVYGDALLTYSDNLTKDFNFSLSGGFTSRSERYKDETSATSQGLVSENFFSLNNSYGLLNTTYTRQSFLKYGFFGILNLTYKNYLFLEGTVRQESASTLPPKNNSYFYPSVSGSFVFTDAFKNSLPSFLSYGKLRASYGVVGNPAANYRANVLYAQTSLQTNNGSVAQVSIPNSNFGNNNLMPEKKHETEFGLETRMFNDRFGLDFTYYQNRIKNQILSLQVAPTNGQSSQIVNAGEIGNTGVEIGLNGRPLVGAFKWQTRLNFSRIRSKVYSLEGVSQIVYANLENSGIQIVVKPGEDIGNIYVYPVATDNNGNKKVDADGYYIIDKTYKKAGNILPKISGGLTNTFDYKNFSLTVLTDYRFGGKIVSTPLKYGISAGMYESTLQYRDAEHGGLSYYIDGTNYVQVASGATAGPAGQKLYHDGVILPGVNANGQPNTKILDAASYYFNSFAAGSDESLNEEGAIYKNNYIKLRELTLGYTLPRSVSSKLHVSNVRFSLIGRNLLYIYRTLKNLDPETLIGSQWYSQGVDNGSLPATRSYGASLNVTF